MTRNIAFISWKCISLLYVTKSEALMIKLEYIGHNIHRSARMRY